MFTIYPIIWAVQKVFYRYTGIATDTHFVGLENFKSIFMSGKSYWCALGNSFLFTVGKLPLELPIAFILALILSKGGIRKRKA